MIWSAILLACTLQAAQAPKGNLETGRRLFSAHCAGCHGPAGDGGKGTSLRQPRLPRAPDAATLVQIIRSGIPGTEMPFTRMTDEEARELAAYVRSLGRAAPPPVRGDPTRGRALFWGKGDCGSCHTAGDRGGRLGPDLTEIGARRSAAHLRTSLLEPEAAVPENFTVYRRVVTLPDNFLQVRVTTRDGRRITGIRLNEDTFSIQLRDFSSRLHSFWKDELVELHEDWGRSPMPSYRGTFSEAELDDLVAYLASLRGAP